MEMQTLALGFFAAVAVGGVAWVFIYPLLSGEKNVEKRLTSVARTTPAVRQVDRTQRSRREQIEGSLKEIETRSQKQKNVPLGMRLSQAGLDWTPAKFGVVSAAIGVVV
ncbi:pilus assembly protein, partial [Rhodopseudomonas sp. WA056]|nr:pilus assembly protein [Rhodopseudomonas sp. WA056]